MTSLDIEWREIIASILAKEAKRRQVIVFTHDLHFLYFLKKHAEQNIVEVLTHWIQQIDGKPGYVSLNNSPALEREGCKTTRAREFYLRSRNSAGEERQNILKSGFSELRSCYEAFIIYELFEEVVMRFDARVSFGRLKDIRWDESIADRVNAKCELLSGYIAGHLQCNGHIVEPDPQMLLDEIEAYDALRRELRELKKKRKV